MVDNRIGVVLGESNGTPVVKGMSMIEQFGHAVLAAPDRVRLQGGVGSSGCALRRASIRGG
ncbi:MAG: hypothetical protein KDB00_05295 [Planctomycetales bacterium]|nr:hypothetical protein [Planctomycetales bacterium]